MDLVRRPYATQFISIIVLGLAAGAHAQIPAPQTTSMEGRSVIGVTFDPAVQPLETSALNGLIPFHTGQPFHAADAQRAIEALYATGRYEDIQVDAEPAADGVSVKFITVNSWFFGHVEIHGDVSDPPNPGQLLSVAGLALGAPFDNAAVLSAEEKIRQLLQSNGFFDADVSHHFEYDATFEQVRVTFDVQVAKRAHYAKPIVTGDTSVLSEKAIDKATGWRRFLFPGYRGITQTRTRTGIDKIRLKYQKSNRLLATVTFSGITPVTDDKRKP